MDGDADETAADHGRLAGMQSHPHAHRLGEGFILERSLRLRRRHDRGSRACEDEHAAIAFAVDELPTLDGTGITENLRFPLQ